MDLVSELWTAMAVTGKVVVTILAILSVYSYTVMIERGLALRWVRERSAEFAETVESNGASDRKVDAILAQAQESEERGYCSLATVVAAGVQELKTVQARGQENSVVAESVDVATGNALDAAVINLRARLSGMATIVGIAPFLGLFGTVTGLISAFRGIAATGSGGLATVSSGISEALVTTVIGLFVAMPALWAYNYYMNRIDVMAIELNNSATRVVNDVVHETLSAS